MRKTKIKIPKIIDKRTGALHSIFLFLMLTIGCSSGASVNNGIYQVTKVIDGDTVQLADRSKLRYIGINTPETMKKISGEWIFAPEPYSVESKNLNVKLIGIGRIKLEFDQDKIDNYGRKLAYVFLEDGKSVNAELIRNGLATVYTFYPNIKYLDLYLELQEEAISKKKGLWSELTTIPYQDAASNIGRMCNVQGKVSKIYIVRGNIILDFTNDNEAIFTAEIPLRNLPIFNQRGVNPFKFYLSKDISIIGKIKDGPSMYVDNPMQIKIRE